MKTKTLYEAIQNEKTLRAEYKALETECQKLSLLCEVGEATSDTMVQYKKIVARLGELDVSDLLLAEMEVKRHTLLRQAESWQEAKRDECLTEARNLENAIDTLWVAE